MMGNAGPRVPVRTSTNCEPYFIRAYDCWLLRAVLEMYSPRLISPANESTNPNNPRARTVETSGIRPNKGNVFGFVIELWTTPGFVGLSGSTNGSFRMR